MTEENKTDAGYIHPHDLPCLFNLTTPLTQEMFLKKPVDVLNAKLHEVIGNKFVAKKGQNERERELTTAVEEVTAEYFEGCRYVGLLFSAEAYAPCHTMLKLVRNFYSDINLDERLFELVLVPGDQQEKDWQKHYMSMPWTSLPYGDARVAQFLKRYNVSGVPQLIILDAKTGFKVTETARKDLSLAQAEEPGVKGVWKNWHKLMEIHKKRGVEAAQNEAIYNAQQELKNETERRKAAIAII